ncbi:MAG: hypothetical protein JZU63_04850 [Rhodoferax sp.]|nr:hypothetical protein [Rhodoferax sp.]
MLPLLQSFVLAKHLRFRKPLTPVTLMHKKQPRKQACMLKRSVTVSTSAGVRESDALNSNGRSPVGNTHLSHAAQRIATNQPEAARKKITSVEIVPIPYGWLPC